MSGAHWSDAYYGELYLASVRDLLTPALSALEADAIADLLALGPRHRVLDLACGHGRHAAALARRVGGVVGVDRSAAYLRLAAGDVASAGAPSPRPSPFRFRGRGRGGEEGTPRHPAFVRGDVRALPFAAGAFDAVYSWYASLLMFDEATNLACLSEAARVVRRGGRILVHHGNPLRLAREPTAAARRTLADGTRVEEESRWDPEAGVDRCARRVVTRAGAVLAATAELRYYSPSEWGSVAARAGLRLTDLTTTTDAGRVPRRAPGPEAPDLIAILEVP